MKKNKPIGKLFYCSLKKTLLVMRIAIILLMLGILQAHAIDAYSQKTRLSLNFSDTELIKVLDTIEEESEFFFLYNEKLLDTDRKVNINANDQSINVILDNLFSGTDVKYTILDRKIILAPEYLSKVPQQQQVEVNGTVKDATNGDPMPGVNIIVQGTTIGTLSDINGKYSLTITNPDIILTYSFIGYVSQEIKYSGQKVIDIKLVQNIEALEEVVVIGYGTAKKSDLTGAIAQIKGDDMEAYAPKSVADMLRTSIPGLNASYSVSAKGSNSFLIRGETTLTAGSNPLIVVDGVIFNGDLSDINTDDIEKMDIMKDASSAAVYGSRATNGVISITTKKGLGEKPTINFSSTVGIATASKRLKPYDADGFIQWRSDWFKSVYSATVQQEPWSPFDDPRLIDPQYLDEWMAYHGTTEPNIVDAWLAGIRLTGIESENYKAGNIMDWEDVIFHNGVRQDYNISLSGKLNDFTYYWSLGYMENEALTKGDDFATIRSRVNLEGQAAKFLKVGLNAQFSYRDESSVSASSGEYRGLSPYGSYYANDGTSLRLYTNDDHQEHPLLDLTYRDRERNNFTIFPKIYSVLNLPFGIIYTMNLTTRMEFFHSYVHDSSLHPAWGLFGGLASRDNDITREWQIDNIISWNRTFADVHHVDITLLANAEKLRLDSDGMSNQNFSPNDVLGYHDMSTGSMPLISSYDEVQTADALMARVNYGFKNRYLLTLSVRRDGSSLFGYSNPRATFPAAALGWVLSEEDFFKADFIDLLKLRASWGINGNRAISNYAALSRIATGKSLNADQSGIARTIPTLVISSMENKDLRWERTESFNLGIDFNMFKGILSGTIDAYTTATTDVLVNRELPTITGFDRVYANLGKVKNMGLELNLNSLNIKRSDFEWRTNLIFSLNRNKIVSITGEKIDVLDDLGNVIGQKEPDDITNNWFIGQSKDVIWDYKILGTWKVGEETEAAKWQQFPGDYRLEDVDKDGLLTYNDKQFLGYTTPRFSWTMSNNFYFYNNFEASFILYSLWGQKAPVEAAKHDGKTRDRYNDWDIPYWTPNNQIDDFCRLASSPSQGVAYNSWFDRSYIRLENIAVSYRIPANLLKKTSISNLKISFNIRNAGFWAPKWEFGDPEDEILAQRIYSFGLNLTL